MPNPAYIIQGARRWIACKASGNRKAGRKLSLEQLNHCRVCPSAQVRHLPVIGYWLSCGPPGEDRTAEPNPTCGCALGRLSAAEAEAGPFTIAENVRKRCRPFGKTKCKAACDQGKW